jgi:hypothetical protein
MRRLLGACLFIAPLLIVVSEVLSPPLSEDGTVTLNLLRTQVVRLQLWVWIGLLAAVLLLPAVLGLLSLAPRRGRGLAQAGAFLSSVGVVGYAAHQALFLTLPTLLTGDPTEMAALYERQSQYAGTGLLIFFVFLIPLFLGFLLLGVAAALAKTAPWWPAAALALAFIPGFLPLSFDAGYLSFGLLLLGLWTYGARLLKAEPTATRPSPIPAAGQSDIGGRMQHTL